MDCLGGFWGVGPMVEYSPNAQGISGLMGGGVVLGVQGGMVNSGVPSKCSWSTQVKGDCTRDGDLRKSSTLPPYVIKEVHIYIIIV